MARAKRLTICRENRSWPLANGVTFLSDTKENTFAFRTDVVPAIFEADKTIRGDNH
jgi:hypothetical protein